MTTVSVARMSGPLDHTIWGVGSPEAIQVRETVEPSTALLLVSGGEKVGGTEGMERELTQALILKLITRFSA